MNGKSIVVLAAVLSLSAVSATPVVFKPITKGLNFQLDAKDGAAFTTDADGRVSAWRASAGRVGFAFTNAAPAATRPYRSALPFGGRGAVVFGYDNDTDKAERPTHLTSNGETTNKTVFLVFHRFAAPNRATEGYVVAATAKSDNLYGVDNVDSTAQAAYAGFYGDTYSRLINVVTAGGYSWNDGVETSNPETETGNKIRICPLDSQDGDLAVAPTLFAGEIAEDVLTSKRGFIGVTSLGHYTYKRSGGEDTGYFHGAIAEILSYDRVLSADERDYTFEYLRNKWMGTGSVVVDGETAVVTVVAGQRVVLGGITGSGTLLKRGTGTLAFLAGGTSTAELRVLEGVVDLSGTTQVVSTVTGDGIVTNAAAVRAALVIANDGASVCEPLVCGDVSLVKCGVGELKVNSLQAYAGGTELAGGALTVVSNVAPAGISGLVLHLDAQKTEFMTKTAAGEVVAWRSSVGDVLFENDETSELNRDNFPVYDAAAFGGRGGVRFGLKPDNTVTGTFLRAGTAVRNRTLFLVVQPNAVQVGSNIGFYGKFGETKYGITLNKGAHQYICSNMLLMNGRDAVNGGVQYDGTEETGTDVVDWRALEDNAPHLLSVVAMDGDSYAYAPAIGGFYLMTQKYYYWQGVIGEVLVYDRALTEDEVQAVERSLMAKWGITPAWEESPKARTSYPETTPDRSNPLGIGQALAVKSDSTIDFNGMVQSLSSLTLDAGEAGAYPVLTLLGSLALNDVELKLVSDGKAPGASQWLVRSAGLTGEFKSVEGGRVRYLQDGVKLAGNGGLILLLK